MAIVMAMEEVEVEGDNGMKLLLFPLSKLTQCT